MKIMYPSKKGSYENILSNKQSNMYGSSKSSITKSSFVNSL